MVSKGAANEEITLETKLAGHTAESLLHVVETDRRIRCVACAHECILADGETGTCGVRSNRRGVLRVPFGYVARRYVRSVETNTIFHVMPGANALTFGMYGCDLRCPYCHNWNLSQAFREGLNNDHPTIISARELVVEAIDAGCRVLCAAYNEPMISAEWTAEIFREAKSHGLATAVITDGNTTVEALEFMRPVTDIYRADVKGWSPEQYRVLGGKPDPVFSGIRHARRLGYWIELVTLIVPEFNDSAAGIRRLASEIAAIDPSIPWHLNAFHPRYRMKDRPRTSALTLFAAAASAIGRGLKFVYVSNLAGQMGELSNTRCPNCRAVIIERFDYQTVRNRMAVSGKCPECAAEIPGVWR